MEEDWMHPMRISATPVVCALLAGALVGCGRTPGRAQSAADPAGVAAPATSAALVELLGGPVDEPCLRAYVSRLGRSLEGDGNRPCREFVLVRSTRLNAFAAPDGSVLLCAGLLRAMPRERALAAVLAHEIGHLRAGHVGAFVAPRTQLLSPAHRRALTLLQRQFTPAQEHQADAIALQLLADAGIDPRGLAEALTILQQHRPTASTPDTRRPGTHPPSTDRIERIHRLTVALDPVRLAEPPERARRRFHAMQRRLAAWQATMDAPISRTALRDRSRP
jgi:predicted Zn-dependent protease